MNLYSGYLAAAGAVALCLTALFLLWRMRVVDVRSPRILLYHMISDPRPGARFNGMRVAPALFERQLRWLDDHGWTSFTMSELIARGAQLPAKAYAITFDDGYADNFEQALPLLQRHKVKATLYLVVDRFHRDWSAQRNPRHDDGELMQEPKLSDAQVRALLDSGLFELGAHTLTHPDLTKLDSYEAAEEIGESRHNLEATFSVPVRSFAYPFGLYDARHLLHLMQSGYTSAVTTDDGVEPPAAWHPLRLRRIKISGRDGLGAFRRALRTGRRGWF